MTRGGQISTDLMLDMLPVGVGAFDAHGVLVDLNPAFARLLPAAEEEEVSCCRLFGCRTPGPLAQGCLTEIARQSTGPLPEVRLDVGPDADRRSVWALASSAGDHVVLVHIRPGALGDRRRRTVPHWTSGPRLIVRALGPTIVSSSEGPIPGAWLAERSGQLLKVLLCRRNEVPHREELAATLWPEASTAAALTSLRHTVFQLRRRLEPTSSGSGSFVATVSNGYRLELARIDVDVEAFEGHLRRADAARVAGDHDALREQLHSAADLYRGHFLAEESYADWAFAERHRLLGLAREALEEAAVLDESAGDLRSAINALRQLAELDPLDLPAQRRLLDLLAATGRHGEAAERLTALTERWRRAFDESLPEQRLWTRAGAVGR